MAAAPEAGILRKNGAPQGRRPDTSQKAPRVRVEFPETWLWSESHTGYLPSDTCGNVWFIQLVHQVVSVAFEKRVWWRLVIYTLGVFLFQFWQRTVSRFISTSNEAFCTSCDSLSCLALLCLMHVVFSRVLFKMCGHFGERIWKRLTEMSEPDRLLGVGSRHSLAATLKCALNFLKPGCGRNHYLGR